MYYLVGIPCWERTLISTEKDGCKTKNIYMLVPKELAMLQTCPITAEHYQREVILHFCASPVDLYLFLLIANWFVFSDQSGTR